MGLGLLHSVKKLSKSIGNRVTNIDSTKLNNVVEHMYEEFSNLDSSANASVIIVAASDEATAIVTGTDKVTFRMPYKFRLEGIKASLTTAGGTGALTTVDVKADGSSILSSLLTIDFGEKTSKTAATPAVLSTTTLEDDAEITIDVTTVSLSATETGLKIYLIGSKL